MYELPSDFDLEQLQRRSLDSVCFGKYQVHHHLSGGYLIEIESEVSINDASPVQLPASLNVLYPLIDQDIQKVSRSGMGTISLRFAFGDVLHIHDSFNQFECYSISLNGKTLVIV